MRRGSKVLLDVQAKESSVSNYGPLARCHRGNRASQQAEIAYANGRVVKKKLFIIVGCHLWPQHDPTHTPWLVTAKHDELTITGPPPASNSAFRGSMKNRRLNILESGSPSDAETNNIGSLIPTPRLIWPVFRFPSPQNKQAGKFYQKSDLATLARLRRFMKGRPYRLSGRSGKTCRPRPWCGRASSPGSRPPNPNDGHVFPGSSGGPVFKLPAGIDRQGHFATLGDVRNCDSDADSSNSAHCRRTGNWDYASTQESPGNTPLPKLYCWSCRTGLSSQAITLVRS